MSKESSRHAGTTKNTYIDVGADTQEGYAISTKSRALAREAIGNETPEDRVKQRCSIAVGDFAMADLMRFNNNPIPAAIAALEEGSPNHHRHPHGADRDPEKGAQERGALRP